MSFFHGNVQPRLRLLRTALWRRFIWRDIVNMTREYGMDYNDLRADAEPIGFVRELLGLSDEDATPNISEPIDSPESFMRAGEPHTFNSEPAVARFLGQLVYYRRCDIVIELGCFVGWATAHMARSLAARGTGRLFAVDESKEYLDTMRDNLQRVGFNGYVTPVQGRSLDEATLRSLPDRADLVFLDTSHAYPATLHEIQAYAPRLSPGGCMVLHDSISAPGVRRSIAEVASTYRILTFATERSNGVTVLQYK